MAVSAVIPFFLVLVMYSMYAPTMGRSISEFNNASPIEESTDLTLYPVNIVKPQCQPPAESGSCYANKERWYFDAKSLACKTFVYGGCGGNSNNFESLADCIANCPTLRTL